MEENRMLEEEDVELTEQELAEKDRLIAESKEYSNLTLQRPV